MTGLHLSRVPERDRSGGQGQSEPPLPGAEGLQIFALEVRRASVPGCGHISPTIHVPLRPPPSFLLRPLQKPSLKFPPTQGHQHLLSPAHPFALLQEGTGMEPLHIPVQPPRPWPHEYACLCCASRPGPLECSTETLLDVWRQCKSTWGQSRWSDLTGPVETNLH